MDLKPFAAFFAVDPFSGAKPRPLRRGKEAPLRVNPCLPQAGTSAWGPTSIKIIQLMRDLA